MGRETKASRTRLCAGGISVALVVAFLIAAGTALGAGSPPPDVSAVSQYVEVVPTGGGGSVSGTDKSRPNSIPARVGTLIVRQGGGEAANLREVVSSSAYGAQKRFVQTPAASAGGRSARPRSSDTLAAVISASGSGTDSRAFWLAAILVVSTLTALVTAGLRQRRRREL